MTATEEIKQALSGNKNRVLMEQAFEKYCPNRNMVRNSRSFSDEKLSYELLKICGIPQSLLFKTNLSENLEYLFNDKPLNVKIREHSTRNVSRNTQKKQERKVGKSTPDIDNLILQTKDKIAKLNVEIAQIHKELFQTGEENTPKIKKQRKELIDSIKEKAILKDKLFNIKENYFLTGKIDSELKSLLNQADKQEEKKSTTKNNTISKLKKEIAQKDSISLMKRAENIRKNITKKLNLLEYQTETKQEEKNQMPEGTKRKFHENKLKELRQEQKLIAEELQKRENKQE